MLHIIEVWFLTFNSGGKNVKKDYYYNTYFKEQISFYFDTARLHTINIPFMLHVSRQNIIAKPEHLRTGVGKYHKPLKSIHN